MFIGLLPGDATAHAAARRASLRIACNCRPQFPRQAREYGMLSDTSTTGETVLASSTSKGVIVLLAGLSLTTALAGCSAATDGDSDDGAGSGNTDTSGGNTDSGSGSGDTSAVYTDGTYSAQGSYQAPSGTESVDVTITLAGDVITAVEVVGNASDPQAKLHQGEFIGGIGDVVVGKDIDLIQVDKVGGSSLTSGGFNKAVEEIKADAAA
jgi:uncharacterized protein with FMN-binding domain